MREDFGKKMICTERDIDQFVKWCWGGGAVGGGVPSVELISSTCWLVVVLLYLAQLWWVVLYLAAAAWDHPHVGYRYVNNKHTKFCTDLCKSFYGSRCSLFFWWVCYLLTLGSLFFVGAFMKTVGSFRFLKYLEPVAVSSLILQKKNSFFVSKNRNQCWVLLILQLFEEPPDLVFIF